MNALRWLLLAAVAAQLGCSTAGPTGDLPVPTPAPVKQALRDAEESHQANVVTVLVDLHGAQKLCTGIVIEPQLVVTAQHCLAAGESSDVAVDCASAQLTEIDAAAQAWVFDGDPEDAGSTPYCAVKRVRMPAGTRRLCGEDLVLLQLAQALPSVAALPLTADVPPSGSEFLAIGNGTDNGAAAMQRQNPHAALVCVGQDCNDERIATTEFLAVSGACAGDSGSPAIDDRGRAFAMAVRSSTDCSETAYLQLRTHIEWLALSVYELAAETNREVPQWASDVRAKSDLGLSDAGLSDGATGETLGRTPPVGCGCASSKANPRCGVLAVLGLLAAVRSRRSHRRAEIRSDRRE